MLVNTKQNLRGIHCDSEITPKYFVLFNVFTFPNTKIRVLSENELKNCLVKTMCIISFIYKKSGQRTLILVLLTSI